MQAIHFAASRGHLEVLRYLLNNKVDANSATRKKMTVLHFAAMNGARHAEGVGCVWGG